jgi:transposase
MPDVISLQPAEARMFVALDVHKLSIVAAILPPVGGRPEIYRIETTEKAIRRFVAKLGGPSGLAVCYEASGKAQRMTHDYKRNGTTSLYAALEIATGEVTGACYPRHTHEQFLAFLNALVRAFPRKPLHVVLDNSSTHCTPEVKRWLERHKRVHFHFTPTGASWLNMVVHAQHQRALRRVQIEADHVDHLLDQLRVVGELRRADLVGLELVLAPDPVHRGRRDPGRLRKPANAPVRGAVRRRLKRLGQHPLDLIVIDLPRPARPRRVPKPLQPPLTEVPAPQPHRRQRHPHLTRYLRVGRTLGRPQHNPGPQRLLLRGRRRSQHAPQHTLLFLGELDRRSRARHDRTVL